MFLHKLRLNLTNDTNKISELKDNYKEKNTLIKEHLNELKLDNKEFVGVYKDTLKEKKYGDKQNEKDLKNKKKLDKIEKESIFLKSDSDYRKLKSEVNEIKFRPFWGYLYIIFGLLITLISALVSVCGIVQVSNKITFNLVVLIAFFTILQFVTPLLNVKKCCFSGISNFLITLYTVIFLITSIFFSFNFLTSFIENRFLKMFTLVLCVLFDVSSIILVYNSSILKNRTEIKNKPENIIFSRLLGLIHEVIDSKLTSIENKVNNYDKNIKNSVESKLDILTNDNNNDIIKTQSTGNNSLNMNNSLNLLNLTNEEIEKYISYAVGNKNSDDYLPSYKEIGKETGLGKNKAYEIKRYLDQIGKTVVVGRRTKLIA